MNPSVASFGTRFRVGIFTIIALVVMVMLTVYVNDRPFWWRPCELVHINVEDATGLKTKSPVRSRGLQIGYLDSVVLSESHVRLGICITAPVQVTQETRAFIKGEGFLGDKYVELRPVKYTGDMASGKEPVRIAAVPLLPASVVLAGWMNAAATEEAHAEQRKKDIPVGEQSQDVQELVGEVDQLVEEMTSLTNSLKQAINPEQLRQTMDQLNQTLKHASRTLAPDGGLNTTAQRTLAKLEDAIEQMRDQMARINRGEGSLGMVLNDPTYAEQLKGALRSMNELLGRVGSLQIILDLGAVQLPDLEKARGWFELALWPSPDRYYRLGLVSDPRGSVEITRTVTTSGNTTTETRTETISETEFLFTAMLGKVFWKRLDLSAGVLYGDGAGSIGLGLGPKEHERFIFLKGDVFDQRNGAGLDGRLHLRLNPFKTGPLSSVYLTGGLESVRSLNDGSASYFYGAGVSFSDEDIRLLFALR